MLTKILKIHSKATDRWIDLIDPGQEDDIRDDQSYGTDWWWRRRGETL